VAHALAQQAIAKQRRTGSQGEIELLGTTDPVKLLDFMMSLLKDKVRGHWPCPCGSKKIIRNCHSDGWKSLRELPKALIVRSGNEIFVSLRKKSAAA
jgi:hypothetical protein